MKKMKWICFAVLCITVSISARAAIVTDTCNANDICELATVIPNVASNVEFACINSCNTGATPDTVSSGCMVSNTPSTWFRVETDAIAESMNIHVASTDFTPTIALFRATTDCAHLEQVGLTPSLFPCFVGSNEEAEAIGSPVMYNSVYYILIGSLYGETGDFQLCVNTTSHSSTCVTSREIVVTGRSNGGPLEGPFDPGETISFCLNVNSYTAANNGCQWFQGMIPVFGNGWDPGSFNPDGQPWNTTLNGIPMGQKNNGVYGTATWDWFTDVDYHYNNVFLQAGDVDGNGTLELCNLLYEADCPNTGGLQGGCCGPCWGAPPGTFLPGGWFAYGINGSCATPGPPIRADWGDGNSCGSGMGPWHFCFDLQVRDHPDCLDDNTTRDLSLGFITTSDGETGAWTGNASICALDQPMKRNFPIRCGTLIDLGVEQLPSICSGDHFVYTIEHNQVASWEWLILPSGGWGDGTNGHQIDDVIINNSNAPVTIRYRFRSVSSFPDNEVIKEVRFTVYPQIQVSMPDLLLCERDSVITLAPPIAGGTGNYEYQWFPTGENTPTIRLYKPFPSAVILHVNDEIGCATTDTMHIKTRPCFTPNPPPDDDDNDPDHPKDPPPPDGNFTEMPITLRSPGLANDFSIKPIPAGDRAIITVQRTLAAHEIITVSDMNGKRIIQYDAGMMQGLKAALDISAWPDGLYIVTLHTSHGPVSRRMVKK